MTPRNKTALVCSWLIIISAWLFLIFFISFRSAEIKEAAAKARSYFAAGPRQAIQPSWEYICGKGWKLIANCEVTPVSGVEGLDPYLIRINSDGFRGREYTVNKPDNVYRVAVLGDSFAFGVGLNLEETFSFQLEKMLNKEIAGKHFEVLNFGVPGMNTAQEIERFKEKALKYRPDLVIIAFLGNDDESVEFSTLVNELGIKHSGGKYEELMNNKRLKNIDFVRQPLKKLEELAKRSGFKILIYTLTQGKEHADLFMETAKANPAVYYKKAGIMHTSKRKFYLHPLDQHPSALANEIYAQELYGIIGAYGLLK